MGRATNRSVRFPARTVCVPGFWRHWGVWGDRSPRSFMRVLTMPDCFPTFLIMGTALVIALWVGFKQTEASREQAKACRRAFRELEARYEAALSLIPNDDDTRTNLKN